MPRRWTAEERARELVRRVERAVSEVRVVQRVQHGEVLDQRVVNPDAIQRALKEYRLAAIALGQQRHEDGTNQGPMAVDRVWVTRLTEELERSWRELDRLRGLAR